MGHLPTPIDAEKLHVLLQGYDRSKAEYLVEGFRNGFRIGYNEERPGVLSPNLKSALQQPNLVTEKLAKEIREGRLAGPLNWIQDHKPIFGYRRCPNRKDQLVTVKFRYQEKPK